MKKLLPLLILFAIAFATPAFAVNATFLVTFDLPAGLTAGDPSVEYVVEAKLPNGTFVEVARGPGSPITFTTNAAFGIYSIRVFSRTTLPRDVPNDTSDEASTPVTPGKPTKPKVTGNRDGSASTVQSASTLLKK